jgi:hypothetical protein
LFFILRHPGWQTKAWQTQVSRELRPGLPDGIFSNQKKLGSILEGLAMENVGLFYGHLDYIFYGHLVYFVACWNILWSIGYIFPGFGTLWQEKSGTPV